jgi:succinate-semialdehyde dehydrogenase / glutarate-semialdehyde dehydrogenase
MGEDMAGSDSNGATTRLRIGGEWVAASDGAQTEVVDPATGAVIGAVANATVADGLDAVAAAAAAQHGWAATAPRERSEILSRAFELLRAEREELAALIVRENGKPLAEARGELGQAAEFLRWFAEEAVRIDGTLSLAPGGDKRVLVTHKPVGVSVCITPWNFPAAMITRKLAPALAAGCTAVLKPAPETPLTAFAIVDVLERAGLPAGVVNVVPSDRPAAMVEAMLAHPAVRKLSFTGSTATGRALLAAMAPHVINPSMELGGNAPFIVFEDADLDAAVQGAVITKLRNNGQSCTAANRFYVAASVADEFTARFAEAAGAMRMGPGSENGTELGPLITSGARDKVEQLTQSAVDHGATVRTGGGARHGAGYFFQPTVLSGLAPDAAILGQEIFGPVAPVVTFDAFDDTLAAINAVEHGLVAYVYTADMARGLRVAESLETGMVGLNKALVAEPAAPFGGVKQSGLGREGGHHGIQEFLEPLYIATDW